MNVPDLFGGESPIADTQAKSGYKKVLQERGYGKAINKEQCCKNCAHIFKKGFHGKGYYKCELVGCSSSSATDIRLGAVCRMFEKESIDN